MRTPPKMLAYCDANRELELLRRALRLAHDRGQLPAVPEIRLSEVVCGAALPKESWPQP